jgi:acetyl esterase/lipase
MNYQDCLFRLKQCTIVTQKNCLSIRIKPIPDDDRAGVPDSRVLWAEKVQKPYPQPKDNQHPTMAEIQAIRDWMGCENLDLSTGVITERRLLETDSGLIPALFYDPGGSANRPVTIYFHGGGFFGGTTRVVENACKLLAERSGSLVVSVEYMLAPEHKFPKGLMQCWQAVNWVHRHAGELGVSPDRLVVMGDSAGANLAIGCCLLDRESIIKMQILLYPCVLLNRAKADWSESNYVMDSQYQRLLHDMVYSIGDSMPMLNAVYVDEPSKIDNPLVSPLLAESLTSMPTTMIVAAEYDYLRQQNEQFALRLSEDKVDTILYLYKGMGHAFFEHTGEFPQAEDCTNEAAEAIRAL